MRRRVVVIFWGFLALYILGLIAITAAMRIVDRSRATTLAKFPSPPTAMLYSRFHDREQMERLGVTLTQDLVLPNRLSALTYESMAESIGVYENILKEFEVEVLGDESWESIKEIAGKSMVQMSEEDRLLVENFLARHRPLIDRIVVASNLRAPVASVDLSQGWAIDYHHLTVSRDLFTLMRMHAIVCSNSETSESAIQILIAGMNWAESIGYEPLIIAQLVRMSGNQQMLDTLSEILLEHSVDPEFRSRLLSRMEDRQHEPFLADTFVVEATIGLYYFRGVRSLKLDVEDYTFQSQPSVWELLGGTHFGRTLLWFDERRYAEIMLQLRDLSALKFYESREAYAEIDKKIREAPASRNLLSIYLMGGQHRSLEAEAQEEALFGMARMALLLEAYREQFGNYPEDLNELRDGVTEELELDPYTGTSFKYLMNGEFLLYSVGRNLTDDGGVHDPYSADIVWQGVDPEY